MPILVPAVQGSPLSQGDLLKDVKLYFTSDAGGSTAAPHGRATFALVLSRPCVAVNKGRITVLAVEKLPHQIDKEVSTFQQLVRRVSAVRDADGTDAFYVGEIPGGDGQRHAARLDFISTLEVPTDPSARGAWTAAHRVATLHVDFRRDLHTRMFLAIAKQGFEDFGWYSNEDLQMIIDFGRAKVAEAQLTLQKTQSQLSLAKGSGAAANKSAGLTQEIRKAEEDDAKRRAELEPYLEEARRRGLMD